MVSANTGGDAYQVNWFFAGAESAYTLTLNAAGGVTYTEADQNNNLPGSPQIGPQPIGTSFYGPGAALSFSVSWPDNGGGTVDNTANQGLPANSAANMIFAYVTVPGGILTQTPTDAFVFAVNDTGGLDDNHDDFVGFAQVIACGADGSSCEQQFTPLPAALPLFGSVLGGGFVAGVWRRRRKVVKA